MKRYSVALLAVTALCLVLAALALAPATPQPTSDFLGNAQDHARQLVSQGQQIFRFDTFGDEAFWGISSACIRSWRRSALGKRLLWA